VLLVERWILAALRHQTFFSLSALNGAIRDLLTRLNARPFRKLTGCRQVLFETLDRPALRPLPDAPYVYAEWRKARVHIDYHVEVDRHYYSVPYQLVKHALEIRLTAHTCPGAIPRSPSTCPPPIASTPNGPRSAWCAGPRRAGRPPPP
jgi:hypothetical protein